MCQGKCLAYCILSRKRQLKVQVTEEIIRPIEPMTFGLPDMITNHQPITSQQVSDNKCIFSLVSAL